MNSSRKRMLTAALSAAALVSSTFSSAHTASSSGAPPDRGRFVMPFGLSLDTGERILSFEDELDEEEVGEQSANTSQLFVPGDTETAWLLEPTTFNRLSSAGQRAVMLINGTRHPERRQAIPLPADVSAEAVPGENIRVNNPALDTDFHTHSETSIAINGNTIIISFNEFNFNGYGVWCQYLDS